MRVLLGSGGFRTPERIQLLNEALGAFFGGIKALLFIPYALADHDGYVRGLQEKGIAAGFVLDGIHRHPDPVQAVLSAQAVFVGGGNTFRLLSELYSRALLDPICQRVRAGMPYLGSAPAATSPARRSRPPTTCPSRCRPASTPWAWCRSRSTRTTSSDRST